MQTVERDQLLKDGVTLTMKAPRSLKLIIRNEAGQPIDGAGVNLTRWFGRSGGFAGDGKTNSSGETLFNSIYEGSSYTWFIQREGYYQYQSSLPAPVVGTPDWKDVVEVKLKSAEMAHGKVVDEKGNALSYANVGLIGQDASYDAKTGSDGSFVIPVPAAEALGYEEGPDGVVPAGAWLKVVYSASNLGAFAEIGRDDLLKKGITIVAKPPQTLTIVIKDPNGKPLKGVQVDAGAWFVSHGEGGPFMYTDDQGKVVANNVYCGANYSIMTTLKGYYRGSREPESRAVGSPDWKNTIELVMEPTDRVQKGKVVDKDGKPISGAQITAYVPDELVATSDSEGRFTLEGLPASSITVVAKKDDLYGYIEVTKDSGEVTITMEKRQ